MTLEELGGKGQNLELLAQAGFPVPRLVVLDTGEYRSFVAAHGLQATIDAALTETDAAAASEMIRAAFRAHPIASGQQTRILDLLGELLEGSVAVRSSATAEDLPEASFAGQQDSFLDVAGPDAVLAAVVECWSSLWTERAITYRARNDVTGDLALAVVVQRMVPARTAGVLFTADPLTGHRGHTVIDAVRGLGEALVSGQVVPDNFVVESVSGRVVGSTPAVTRAGVDEATPPILSVAELRELTELGARIAHHFGAPQDIEWAHDGIRFWVVQSRAITNLFPVPGSPGRTGLDGVDAGQELAVWASFGAFQGMLQPITTLGQDVLLHLFAGAGRLFGRTVRPSRNGIFSVAGERLWMRLDLALRHPVGQRVLGQMLPVGDPASAEIIKGLLKEPGFGDVPIHRVAPSPAAAGTVARVARGIPGAWVNPAGAVARLDAEVERILTHARELFESASSRRDPRARLQARLDATNATTKDALAALLPRFVPVMATAMVTVPMLRDRARAANLPNGEKLVMEVLRSLPGNVTTAMDLTLWETATRIRRDGESLAAFTETDSAQLGSRYLEGDLPPVAQAALREFLARYGMRGVAEIDLGAPRWRDDPGAVVQALQSYLQIDDPALAPDVVHAHGQRVAEDAIETLAASAAPMTARQIRFVASRLRGLLGARESPKFCLVRCLGHIREALLASGADLVEAGILDRAEDVVHLHLTELATIWDNPDPALWRQLVAERIEVRGRELRRVQVPRIILGDGRVFHEGLSAGEGAMGGQGVSPGVAEGLVRVVHDPKHADLKPGEILVCQGTDPAWTPLFLAAGGLVTEVGGLMTHGSVVAREYGIPAVVGVHQATTNLVTGQRIRLDGTSGVIELLEAED